MRIPIYKPWITKVERDILQDAVDSGWFSSIGEYINLFENEFSKFIGSKYSVSLNSGTSACHLSLLGNGIKSGDEVIIPASTFIACANAVKYCNATPILADIDKNTWNISLDEIKKKVTKKTKAVFLVHMLGNPCGKEIYEWCKENNILCIEDACESIGASLNGKKTGILGKCAAFSFFGNKNLTTGEGGMITTNDASVFEKVKYLKGQAQDETYVHGDIGYNYRMTNIQAALGYAQMLRIKEILSEKDRVFNTYRENLNSSIGENLKLQETTVDAKHSNWMFAIYSSKINEIKENLNKKGIDTRPMFYPVNSMKPYASNEVYKNAIDVNKKVIMLPSFPELKDAEIKQICDVVKKAL